MATEAQPPQPATTAEIIAILGQVDDETLAAIRRTGATAAEVLEAFAWATADDSLGSETERTCRGTVAEVCAIIAALEVEDEER